MSSPRTVRPNGPLIRKLRIVRGWSQADLAWETQLAMERLAENEPGNGSSKRRAQKKTARGRSAGISENTVYRVENNITEVYAKTLWIIAHTLGVPMESLIANDEPDTVGDEPCAADDKPATFATRRYEQPEEPDHPSPDL